MNNEQLLSLARWVLTMVGGFLISGGYVNEGIWTSLSGALLTIISIVWSMYTHTNASQISNVASMPQVRGVVTTTKSLADSIPNDKVVSLPNQVK